MCDLRRISHASMVSLVKALGCYDAVAETINSRWGSGSSKGTISKKVAGHLEWTLADVIALEDALLRYPVTRALALRRQPVARDLPQSLVMQSGAVARETGEAISAILAAEQSVSADDQAQAVQEINEAIDALSAARDMITRPAGAGGS